MVQKVKVEYRNKILETNAWIDSNEKYGLILTDDLDSLLGTSILKSVKGWNVEQVFLFKTDKENKYDYLGQIEGELHEAVGVDLALMDGKCFDNHLTAFSYGQKPNPQSVNLNNLCGIYRGNYGHKYNTSTVLLLWSLYNLPKENLSEELMMVLLSIDGTQDAYYLYQGKYRATLRKWLVEILDLPEFYKCFERHCHADFVDVRKKYNFDSRCSDGKGKIFAQKGNLTTKIDIDGLNDLLAWECDVQIELPKDRFRKKATYRDVIVDVTRSYPSSIEKLCNGEIYSYAITRTNLVNYSVKIEN